MDHELRNRGSGYPRGRLCPQAGKKAALAGKIPHRAGIARFPQ
jgi:hypothetical protein